MVWEARHNLDTLVFGRRPYKFSRHFAVTAFVVGLSCTIGILAPNIQIVLELVGSTCSPIMVYILPGLFFVKAMGGPVLTRKNAPALALIALGCTLIPLCLFIWVLKYVACPSNSTLANPYDVDPSPALCTKFLVA